MCLDPMASAFIRETWRRGRQRRPFSDERRDESEVAMSQQHLEPPRVRRGKEFPLELPEGTWPCQHLHLRQFISQTRREYISVVVSNSKCGNLL
jgi:hypothetical protein